MKLLSYAFVLALPLFSCSQKKYTVEDELYQCMTDVYASDGIDIVEISDSIETFFIESGVLDDASGDAKISLYEAIAETGEAPTLPSNSFFSRLIKFPHRLVFMDSCISEAQIDSTTILNSTFHKAQQKAQELLTTPGGITPKKAAKLTLEMLTAKDFEHPYFRSQFLVSILLTANKDKAYIRSIPEKTPGPKTDSKNH